MIARKVNVFVVASGTWEILYNCPQLVAKLTFDAVLLAAYGFHDYLEAGNTLTRPQFSPDICSNGSTAPWEEGRAMMDYWKQVSGCAMPQNFVVFLNNSPEHDKMRTWLGTTAHFTEG